MKALAATAICLLVPLFLSGCEKRLDDDGAAAFLEAWRLAFNSHDLPSFIALYSQKGSFLVPPMVYAANSPTQLRSRMDRIWRQWPDVRILSIDEVLVGGDRIAFRWRMAYTHRNRKKARVVGATFMRLQNGLIKRERSIFERAGPTLPVGGKPCRPADKTARRPR